MTENEKNHRLIWNYYAQIKEARGKRPDCGGSGECQHESHFIDGLYSHDCDGECSTCQGTGNAPVNIAIPLDVPEGYSISITGDKYFLYKKGCFGQSINKKDLPYKINQIIEVEDTKLKVKSIEVKDNNFLIYLEEEE